MGKLLLPLLFLIIGATEIAVAATPPEKIKVLIIDGQNNHSNMKKGTQRMKAYLLATGIFDVDVATTPPAGKSMQSFKPDFSKYRVVVSNYNGASWPEATNTAFDKFMYEGGGLVTVHAADNAFPEWAEFNQMIGLGGWGKRNEEAGPYVYYDEQQKKFIEDIDPGIGGSHGHQHEFIVKTRDKNHPITKGLPEEWLHQKDELYDRLRGPAEHLTVLATAFSPKDKAGSGRHEPVLMAINYGKGRVFHTTLGHEDYSQKCVGFMVTFQRGVEWAATGQVTQPVPADFPTATQGKARP
jgi:hypothetical protein